MDIWRSLVSSVILENEVDVEDLQIPALQLCTSVRILLLVLRPVQDLLSVRLDLSLLCPGCLLQNSLSRCTLISELSQFAPSP